MSSSNNLRCASLGACVLLAGALVACGSGGDDGGAGAGGGGSAGSGGGSAGSGGGSAGSGGAPTLSEAECNTDLDRFVDAGCDDAAKYTQLKTAACAKIGNSLSTGLCETPLSRAKAAHADFQSATLTCVAGPFGTLTDSPDNSAIDVLLGVYCAGTVNNSACAGALCTYSTDCPSDVNCNDATGRCVNMSAACPGLPCTYSIDCPDGFTCNNGTGQCNAN